MLRCRHRRACPTAGRSRWDEVERAGGCGARHPRHLMVLMIRKGGDVAKVVKDVPRSGNGAPGRQSAFAQTVISAKLAMSSKEPKPRRPVGRSLRSVVRRSWPSK